MATIQYKIQLDESIVERLNADAKKYGERSGNSIASDVITKYLGFYEAAKEAEMAVYHRQLQILEGEEGKEPASKTLPRPDQKRRA